MPRFRIDVYHGHPVVPPFKAICDEIQKLTGRAAKPQSCTGLQIENPSTVYFDGTMEEVDKIREVTHSFISTVLVGN